MEAYKSKARWLWVLWALVLAQAAASILWEVGDRKRPIRIAVDGAFVVLWSLLIVYLFRENKRRLRGDATPDDRGAPRA